MLANKKHFVHVQKTIKFAVAFLKHGVIPYNEAEVFSLSITNPNGRPMLLFDWLFHSGLILVHCHKILFFCYYFMQHVPLQTFERMRSLGICQSRANYLKTMDAIGKHLFTTVFFFDNENYG